MAEPGRFGQTQPLGRAPGSSHIQSGGGKGMVAMAAPGVRSRSIVADVLGRQRRRILRGGLDPAPPTQSTAPTLAEIAAAKARLRAVLPSEVWVEAVTYGARVVLVAAGRYVAEQCPPPCDHASHRGCSHSRPCEAQGMRRCRGCGRWTPPQCIGSSGHCDDCRYGALSPMAEAMLPSSRSIVGRKQI